MKESFWGDRTVIAYFALAAFMASLVVFSDYVEKNAEVLKYKACIENHKPEEC